MKRKKKRKKIGVNSCGVMAALLAVLLTGCAQTEGETPEAGTQEVGRADTEGLEDLGDSRADTEGSENLEDNRADTEGSGVSMPGELVVTNPGNEYYCREGQKTTCRDGIVLEQVVCRSNSISNPETWMEENELFLPFCDEQYFYMVSETDQGDRNSGSLSLQLYDVETSNLAMVLKLDDFSYAEGYEPEPDQEYDFVRQSVFWAQSEGDILYLTIGHSTYAEDCPYTGYLLAVDLTNGEVLWKTHEQVANAHSFVMLEDAIITGYGFTQEADHLYIIDKGTGMVENCVRLSTAPDYLVEKEGQLYVHTYDTDYVFRIGKQSEQSRNPQTARERLQNLPGTYEELCKTWDVCVFDQKQEIVSYNGMGCLADFLEAVEDGTPENVTLARKTEEGTQVLTYISYNGSDFYVMEDTFREAEKGDEDSYTEKICSYAEISRQIGEIPRSKANQELTLTEQSQLRVFAQNREQWQFQQEEYGPYNPVYAVYDLDGDGRLELMASVCMGTGYFSENHYYRISEDGKTVETLARSQLTDAGYEDVVETDGYDVAYRMIDAYRDFDGRIYYAGNNGMKNGAAFYGNLGGFFSLQGNTMVFQDLRQYIEQLDQDTDEFVMTYYDTRGNEITENAYDKLLTDFVQGMERHSVYLNWFGEDEVREDTEEGWYQKLAQSYRFALYY